ncbi:MAG: hypothetical protein CBC16_01165 [Verrucomicrobia bacterium TMED56]|nr:MAG: hypothetical protein CBC16_01165 [Verrucomicrobia bacterium TMED56]|tara:strand:+ start:187 stop:417 length:231 start_codon:yes stop_codon:yes gene_type:complete
MDKINMINYQQYVLKEKFGKRQEKKTIRNTFKILLSIFLICVFFSLLFSNAESQVLVISSDTLSPGFLNLGEYLYG